MKKLCELPKESGIYLITNIINLKKWVGQATNIKNRYNSHNGDFIMKRNSQHLQRAYEKYGAENFTFEILELCPISELGKREGYWMKFYNSLDRDKGYNIEETTEEGGKIFSQETRDKISKSGKGKVISEKQKRQISEFLKGNKHALGNKHTEEYKENMSERMSGDKNPMFGVSLNGEDHGMFGKKHSEDTIKKMKVAKKAIHIRWDINYLLNIYKKELIRL